MKKNLFKIATIAFGLFFATNAKSQLADGSIAPNFTSTDINGTSWDLYTILNSGKTVFIDISATWCAPCWAFHNSKSLDSLWQFHGPVGGTGVNAGTTDDIFVFFVEGDATTNTACLTSSTGCNSTTQGNWVAGTNYPILDDAAIANSYAITYFPTLFMICPDKIVRCCSPSVTGTYNSSYYLNLASQNCWKASALDAGLHQTFPVTLMSCDSVTPTFKLTNYSTANLTAATITIKVDGTTQKVINWTGSLATYSTTTVTGVKVGATGVGTHTITGTVSAPNGGSDGVAANDATTMPFSILSNNGGPLISETFQAGIPSGYIIQNGGDQTQTWLQGSVGGFMTSTKSITYSYYNSPTGDVDAFILDPQSFASAATVTMKFDLSKAAYSTSYNDVLKVKVSSNCGQTWATVYNKADNSGLTTTAATTSQFTPTSAAQWRTETVSLNAYANISPVMVMFEGTSGYGNDIFIDNINFTMTSGIKQESNVTNVEIYPNPASTLATFEVSLASTANVAINFYNNMGQIVLSQSAELTSGDNKVNVNTESLAGGIYNVMISSKEGFVTKKLSIVK